jgi:hypothetical protein
MFPLFNKRPANLVSEDDLIVYFFNDDDKEVRDSVHETLEDAYDAINNVGSKWVFYPHAKIVKNGKILEIFHAY